MAGFSAGGTKVAAVAYELHSSLTRYLPCSSHYADGRCDAPERRGHMPFEILLGSIAAFYVLLICRMSVEVWELLVSNNE
jgi:hypothetical protein